jgi:hypothetical protein
MTETIEREPKLIIPALKPFYDRVIPLAWPVIRIAVGWNLLVHGWGKVTRGPAAFVRGFTELGFDPALPWVWAGVDHRVRRGHRPHSRPVHALLRRRRCHRASDHHRDLLAHRLLVAQPRLRIHPALGPGLLRDRVARRRTLLARPQDRDRALSGRPVPAFMPTERRRHSAARRRERAARSSGSCRSCSSEAPGRRHSPSAA